MRFAASTILFLFLSAFTLIFQNCGRFAAQKDVQSSISSANNDPTNWVQGQPFDYSHMPADLQSQMVQVQLDTTNYKFLMVPRAIAIADNGLGFVRIGTASTTQAQVNQLALDACYAISGGKPCGVVAAGNSWTVSRNNIRSTLTYSSTTPTSISASSIPFVEPAQTASLINAYLNATAPKAMAIGLDGSFFWVGSTTQEPVASSAEAQRLVLERCELSATVVPCTLYAADSSIVYNPKLINRSPVIDYARVQVATNIPGLRQAIFTSTVQNDYLTKVNGTSMFGVIYITSNGAAGSAFYDASQSVAETKALDGCRTKASPSFPCFRYAVNKGISSLAPNITSLRSFNLEWHCKVVPRSSCRDHFAMGCANGGNYYVEESGSIQLKTCSL